MWDYAKLKGRTVELGLRQEDVGGAIGLAPATYSLKLNNKTEFRQSEIQKICDLLRIPSSEISSYFFTRKVRDSELQAAMPAFDGNGRP